MSAETKAFTLQKKGVIFFFWRGEALLNRRAREKKERREEGRGVSKIESIEGPGSARVGQSRDILGVLPPKA